MSAFTCALPEEIEQDQELARLMKQLHFRLDPNKPLVAWLEREVWRGEHRIRRMMGKPGRPGPKLQYGRYKQFPVVFREQTTAEKKLGL